MIRPFQIVQFLFQMGFDGGRMGGYYLCFGVVLMGIATMFYCISIVTPEWITGQVGGPRDASGD